MDDSLREASEIFKAFEKEREADKMVDKDNIK